MTNLGLLRLETLSAILSSGTFSFLFLSRFNVGVGVHPKGLRIA